MAQVITTIPRRRETRVMTYEEEIQQIQNEIQAFDAKAQYEQMTAHYRKQVRDICSNQNSPAFPDAVFHVVKKMKKTQYKRSEALRKASKDAKMFGPDGIKAHRFNPLH
jgi:hypothetical protein